jgi:hypothetical protein
MLLHSAITNLPEALAGCKVFPCIPNGKLPATKNGWKDASVDAAQIAAWGAANPGCNWAVASGLSGLFVIDVDPNGMEWWLRQLNSNEALRAACAETLQVRTPRGGLHVYFRGEGPSTASRIAPGIDTRGGLMRDGQMVSGGYVILPGSRTEAGPYAILQDRPISGIDGSVRNLLPERARSETHGLEKSPGLDQPRNVAWAVELLQGYVASGRVSLQGKGGNDTAFRVITSILDKAISPAACYDLLQTHWNDHCQPPWDDWELETLVRNAAEYGEDTKTGAKGFQANVDAFASFVGLPSSEEPETLLERKRLVWLMDDYEAAATDPTWLLPGFLPSEGVGMLYGPSGSYKTFLALDMASCLSHGIPGQWGAPPLQQDVLYLAGEQPKAMSRKRRPAWREWQNQQGQPNRLHVVDHVPFFHDKDAWTALKLELGELSIRPSLIIMDTLSRFMTGLDESNTKEANMVVDFLEKLARYYECFVLVIHHTGKDLSKGARGSSLYHANMDVMLETRKKDNGTALHVKKQKEIDEPDKPYLFQVKEVGNSIVLERTEELTDAPTAGKSTHAWMNVETITKILARHGKLSTNLLAHEIASTVGVEYATVRKKLMNNPDLKWFRIGADGWGIPEMEYDL